MKDTIGFIGVGNMGGALARAAAKVRPMGSIVLADADMEKAAALARETGGLAADNETAARCGLVFLGVKPQILAAVLADIAPVLAAREDEFVLVSMAAGVTIARVQEMAGGAYPVIRIMPNTPVAVGAGLIQYDHSPNVTEEMLSLFLKNMSAAGILDRLPESLIDAGSAVAGCGPAFADLFIEALADGGVACGLSRDKALLYAAQMLRGAAQLVIDSGEHPARLKDAVCSPGGSTIAGVRALEEHGFRAACIAAVDAAFRRTVELGK